MGVCGAMGDVWIIVFLSKYILAQFTAYNIKITIFPPRPIFETILSGQSYRCKLTLPQKAAFQTIIGPDSLNARLAKKLACLEACKKLHELGAVNDFLLPTGTKPPKKDPNLHVQISTSGAG